ncbi:hypothetical protein ANO14919_073100 [Xylariales sp. No.14919]|nr:hypothetical protein ANO14919_073100 [Xylariales sp. No.14919]
MPGEMPMVAGQQSRSERELAAMPFFAMLSLAAQFVYIFYIRLYSW